MIDKVIIKQLSNQDDATLLDNEFSIRYQWYTSSDYFVKCLEENLESKRITLKANYEEVLRLQNNSQTILLEVPLEILPLICL
jgi:hypothetical protein